MKRNRQKRDLDPGSEAAPIASPDTDVENFGPWLKQQREVREIEAREVADASKISVRYIEALETNRFEVLPAEVFTKGFLRQYAVYVGLDPEEVVNYYLAALQAQRDQEEPDPELTPRPRGSRGTNAKWLLAALVIGALLISVVWLLFTMSDRMQLGGDESSASSDTPSASSRSSRAVGSGAVGSGAPASGTADNPTPSGDDNARAGQSAPSTESMDPRASTSLATPDPGLNGGLASAASEQGAAATPQPPAVPSAVEPRAADSNAPLSVVIDFSGDCWVEATIDEGRRLAEMRVQGESLRLEAQRQLQIKLGDVRVAEILVNGMPFSLEPNPGSSVVDLLLDLETVAGLRAANANVRNRSE